MGNFFCRCSQTNSGTKGRKRPGWLRTVVFLYFVFTSSGAWSHQTVEATPQAATAPGTKFAKSPLATLQKGTVVDNIYRNPSLGLEITPAPDLKLGPPEIKGNPGTVPLLVTVAAWGDKKWFSESNRMAFYADALD